MENKKQEHLEIIQQVQKNKKEKCVHWIRTIDSSIPIITTFIKKKFLS